MTQIRPMLAAQKYREAGDLWGPLHEAIVQQHLQEDGYLIMQPKIDGMRCMFSEGVPRSRSWKPLANKALQQFAQEYSTLLHGLDGEIVTGHVYDPNVFRESMSGIRSAEGSKAFTFYAFDLFNMGITPQYERRKSLEEFVEAHGGIVSCQDYNAKIVLCPQTKVYGLNEIYDEEARLLAAGWEGGIIRRPTATYKFGRSTALGGALTKVKRRNTVDAQVIGYEPRYANQNEAKTSELGYTTRSAHQENLVQLEMLGALRIRLLDSGIEQKCGVFRGLTHDDLRTLWQERETLAGRYCEVSVDSASGGYDSSRCPVWMRWRDKEEF